MRRDTVTYVLGVPLNSGNKAGVEEAPEVLRELGLMGCLRSAKDGGDLMLPRFSTTRDAETGILGLAELIDSSRLVRGTTFELLESGEKPLLIGGDCSLVLAAMAAARDYSFHREVGLVSIDGHLDGYDGKSSPSGEASDMGIYLATRERGLVPGLSYAPIVSPRHTVILGCRDEVDWRRDGAPDPQTSAPGLRVWTPEEISDRNPSKVGSIIEASLARTTFNYWVHLDVDVLSNESMPAVDYPLPDGGLTWCELVALAKPLVRSSRCLGVDVTIYNPRKDPQRVYGKKFVTALGELFC